MEICEIRKFLANCNIPCRWRPLSHAWVAVHQQVGKYPSFTGTVKHEIFLDFHHFAKCNFRGIDNLLLVYGLFNCG